MYFKIETILNDDHRFSGKCISGFPMKYLPKRATSRWLSSASDPTKNAHDKKDEQVLQNTDNTCLSQSTFYVGIDGSTINISLSCTSNACTSGHERNLFANQSLCLATNSATVAN